MTTVYLDQVRLNYNNSALFQGLHSLWSFHPNGCTPGSPGNHNCVANVLESLRQSHCFSSQSLGERENQTDLNDTKRTVVHALMCPNEFVNLSNDPSAPVHQLTYNGKTVQAAEWNLDKSTLPSGAILASWKPGASIENDKSPWNKDIAFVRHSEPNGDADIVNFTSMKVKKGHVYQGSHAIVIMPKGFIQLNSNA